MKSGIPMKVICSTRVGCNYLAMMVLSDRMNAMSG